MVLICAVLTDMLNTKHVINFKIMFLLEVCVLAHEDTVLVKKKQKKKKEKPCKLKKVNYINRAKP